MLAFVSLQDGWVSLHGERRAECLGGYTFPLLQRSIDRVHLLAVAAQREVDLYNNHTVRPQGGSVASIADLAIAVPSHGCAGVSPMIVSPTPPSASIALAAT